MYLKESQRTLHSPPPACCQTGRSCWCPDPSSSDPVRTGRRPGCCPWQPSAAGWWRPRVPTPRPTSRPGCAAAPGKATPLGLRGKKTRRQGDVKPTSHDFFEIRSVTRVLEKCRCAVQFTVQAVWQSNTHTSRSPHFPARCLHSWMTRCPATKRLTKMKWHDTTWNTLSSSSSLDYLFCSL